MWVLLLAALVTGLFSPEVRAAQDVAANSKDNPTLPTPAAARDQDFTLGLAYQGPTRLTGSATLMWGQPRMLVAWAPAKLAQVRVGTGGAQVGLGLAAGVFEESAWRPSGIAVTLKAVGIRTWREPDGRLGGHSYAGIESDIVLLGIRGSVGYARKVAGRGGPSGRFVWSLGLGL